MGKLRLGSPHQHLSTEQSTLAILVLLVLLLVIARPCSRRLSVLPDAGFDHCRLSRLFSHSIVGHPSLRNVDTIQLYLTDSNVVLSRRGETGLVSACEH